MNQSDAQDLLHLLRDALLAICTLPDASFQSLLNYASSRCRAIAFTYVMRRTSLEEDNRSAFINEFQKEMSIANFFVGAGVTIHDGRVFAPHVLRGLTRLIMENRLDYVEDLLREAQDTHDQEDRILPQYMSDWWSRFPGSAIDVTPIMVIDGWKKQFSGLPAPLLTAQTTFLSINALPDANIAEAIAAARDALRLIDLQITRNGAHLGQVAITLGKLRVLRGRLAQLEERGVQEEMKLVAESRQAASAHASAQEQALRRR